MEVRLYPQRSKHLTLVKKEQISKLSYTEFLLLLLILLKLILLSAVEWKLEKQDVTIIINQLHLKRLPSENLIMLRRQNAFL
jgi:hypothetical protein